MNSMPHPSSSSADGLARRAAEHCERPLLGGDEREPHLIHAHAPRLSGGHDGQLVERKWPHRAAAGNDERDLPDVASLDLLEQAVQRLLGGILTERDAVRPGADAPWRRRPARDGRTRAPCHSRSERARHTPRRRRRGRLRAEPQVEPGRARRRDGGDRQGRLQGRHRRRARPRRRRQRVLRGRPVRLQEVRRQDAHARTR